MPAPDEFGGNGAQQFLKVVGGYAHSPVHVEQELAVAGSDDLIETNTAGAFTRATKVTTVE